MAEAVTIFKPGKASEAEPDELQTEALQRLQDARAQKQLSINDIEQCYFYASPRRVRSQQSQSQNNLPSNDADELHTSLAYECSEDFLEMIIESFMPEAVKWAERRPDPGLDKVAQQVIEHDAGIADDMIFDLLRASNFYAELAKQAVPDGAIGVFAMIIRDKAQHKPVLCLGQAIRQIEINIGPDGAVDDRFMIRRVKNRNLKAELPGIKLPDDVEKKVKDAPNEKTEVIWGYWRDWSNVADEEWQHVVLVQNKKVHEAKLKGEGCCEFIVGRFGSSPDFAWPEGPLIRALPEFHLVDDTEKAFIENMEFTIRPPIAYDDDNVMNFENGIEPGMAYPRRPGGNRDSIEKIYDPNPLDAAMFQHDRRESRIRRLHYVDFPEQLGKTPPTAEQWMDQMVKAQKKIGAPGFSFWREFPYQVFKRFQYIAEKRGVVPKLEYQGKEVSLAAYNPAQRAQENQEVLTAMRLLEIINTAFPQMGQMLINGITTSANLKDKLGDKLVEFNDMKQIQQMAQVAASAAGLGGEGGAPPEEGAPPEGAPPGPPM